MTEVEAIDTLHTILNGFDFSYILSILQGVIPAFICITLHEVCHGWAAYLMGDNTAKSMGRLSLNPIKHIDIMGLVMMVVFHFGWAKPVPINMYNFKDPKRGMALTALAGPAANVVIAVVFLALYGLLLIPLGSSAVGDYILEMIYLTAYMSVGLAVFNLIPISPLDGSKVLFSFLDNEKYYKLMHYERYGSIALFALVFSGILGDPLSKAVRFVFNHLIFIAQACFDAVLYFM